MRRLLGMVLALSLSAAALAACGDEEPDQGGPAPAEFEIPVGHPTYDVDAATWAVKTSIHVGDVEITADPAPEVYVVTRSGIYYVAKNNTLYFTDGGPAAKVTELNANSLGVSPDLQRLALIDRAHGPVDDFDSHVAVPVVFDLETGEQVFRGKPGRDPEDDDLVGLYSEIPPAIIGLDDEAVYAVDPLQEEDRTRFPLDGSPPEPIKGNPMVGDESGIEGFAIERPKGRYEWAPTFPDDIGPSIFGAVLSPAEDVFFTNSGEAGRYYDVETGDPTPFSETPFALGGWIDDDTFYGAFSNGGSSEGPSGTTVIASCDVGKQPKCTRVSAEFKLPNRPTLVWGTGKRFAF